MKPTAKLSLKSVVTNVIIVAILASVMLVAVYATDTPNSAVNATSAIYGGSEDCGKVAFMFNVYENAETALNIAKLLNEQGFRATFFVGGKWVERNPSALLALYNMGMEIGNHGYLHRDHKTLDYKKNLDEITLTERLLDAHLKVFPDYENSKLFAPPSGSIGDNMLKVCDDLGYRVIMWTRDTVDWRDQDVDVIYERAIKDIRAGDLVLMHPTEATLSALPRILEYIKSVGLVADTVSNVIE